MTGSLFRDISREMYKRYLLAFSSLRNDDELKNFFKVSELCKKIQGQFFNVIKRKTEL